VPPEVKTQGGHARPRRTRTWAPWVPWLSGVVATASIVVAVLFGFAQAHTRQELNQAQAVNQAISLLLSSPQATLLSHSTTKGGVATVVLVADKHELAVITNGLPELPAGQVYQLWLIGTKKIVSAGLLPPATAGRTPAVLASGVVKGDTLGLTVEPAPGSTQPTTTPILALPLPV
jgi:anti-sigma-K factor RskA